MEKPYHISNKYNYNQLERIENPINGRLYKTPYGNIPSVTTILSKTKKSAFLDEWKSTLGYKADAIIAEAASIGTVMHENLEFRLQNLPDHQGNTFLYKVATKMADVIESNAFSRIDEVWGLEVPLYYKNLWAGTTDLVGVFNGIQSIMDYKNARKFKEDEYLIDYKYQCAAYAIAHDELYGTNIKQSALFICIRNNDYYQEYQECIINEDELNEYKIKWCDRVQDYYTNYHNKD